MKKKALKKMLAGVSAVAMLGSALPMTLIADAYSYNNVAQVNSWATLQGAINADTKQNGALKFDTATPGNVATFANGLSSVNLEQYNLFNYARYQTGEVYATNASGANVSVTSATYDKAAAEADIKAQAPDQIKGVTFDDLTGEIKTITLSMPVNNGNGGVTDIGYTDIEFTVVRDHNDILASFSNNPTNAGRAIILAKTIDLTSGAPAGIDSLLKQLAYTGDIDINLNGFNLTTNSGIQVSGKKMRIWGSGTISSKAGLNSVTLSDSSTLPYASTLGAYGSKSTIELYDKVNIVNNENTDYSKATISGEGKLIICGDEVTVEHKETTNGKAIGAADNANAGITTFVAGDYTYATNANATAWDGTDAAAANFLPSGNGTGGTTSNVRAAYKFTTKKNHNYNQWGFEVTDRTGDWSSSTKYLDIDPIAKDTQFGYEPARASNDLGIASVGASQTAKIKNEGQLYWAAKNINNGNLTGTVTLKLEKSLDFSKAPTNWTPIDASNITLDIDGNYIQSTINKYSVIKGMKVTATNGNGAFISKTKSNVANVIKNIGFENATVTATGGYAAAVVAEADSVAIKNVYVNNVSGGKITGKYVGAIAGLLYNSAIDHTYSAASAVSPVYMISGSTVTYLAKDGVKTAMGQTNFYDSNLTPAPNDSSETYIVGATSTEFKDGHVAFMLNGHNPKQVVAASTLAPKAWGAETGSGNGSCSVDMNTVAPWNRDYIDDVFGQTLDGKSYPTFINITNGTSQVATNRVFREVVTTCAGVKEEWTADNANFLNSEIDPKKSGHKDVAPNNHICDVCGAYEITTDNFDASLIPFLTVKVADGNAKYGLDGTSGKTVPDYDDSKTAANDGWLNYTEIDAVNKLYFDLTTADTKSLKVADIVNAINAPAPTGTEKDLRLQGLNILNKKLNAGSLVDAESADKGTKLIDKYIFIVNDKVLCRKTSRTAEDKGYLVATKQAASTDFEEEDATWAASFEGSTATASSMESTANAEDSAKFDFYVFADAITASKQSLPTAQFKRTIDTVDYTYRIAFRGGVEHNTIDDKKLDGTWDIDSSNPSSPSGTQKVKLEQPVADKSIHTYKGVECGCKILEEECDWTADPDETTMTAHKMECAVCGKDSTSKGEKHDFVVVFTSGNVSFKRCMGCGYCVIDKDTNIIVSEPTIKIVEGDSPYRQAYSFDIAAGNNTILSYGVLYSKEGASIDTDKIAIDTDPTATNGKYFNNAGTIIDAKLGGLQKTVKKAITTGGTYKITASLPNTTDDLTICGYVVYKEGGTVKVTRTKVMKNNFADLAYAEAENACYINQETNFSGLSASATSITPRYAIEVDADYEIVTYGLIYASYLTAGATAFTDETTLDSVDGTTIKKTDRSSFVKDHPGMKSVYYNQGLSLTSSYTRCVRGYVTVKGPNGKFTIYSDVDNVQKS